VIRGGEVFGGVKSGEGKGVNVLSKNGRGKKERLSLFPLRQESQLLYGGRDRVARECKKGIHPLVGDCKSQGGEKMEGKKKGNKYMFRVQGKKKKKKKKKIFRIVTKPRGGDEKNGR